MRTASDGGAIANQSFAASNSRTVFSRSGCSERGSIAE
jgi:hypothetical protein